MAKASERDIDAAGDAMVLLNTISGGYYPAREDEDDAPLHFDRDDIDHLRRFYDEMVATLDAAPGWQNRVIGGMCYVILFPANQIVDPDADTLELHPKFADDARDAARYRWLRDRPGLSVFTGERVRFKPFDSPHEIEVGQIGASDLDQAIDAAAHATGSAG